MNGKWAAVSRGKSLAPDNEAIEQLGDLANNVPKGAIVELGTFKGGSAVVLGKASRRHVWCFDTWSGIPAPGPVEVDGEKAQRLAGAMVASKDEAKSFLDSAGVQSTLIKGDWCNTLTPELVSKIGPIAMLHIDGDWFKSVLHGLRVLEPCVVAGGFIVLDDFAWWEGARLAFYAWCKETGAAPVIRSNTRHQLWWQKGREHYRP